MRGPPVGDVDGFSSALARRALLITSLLALIGSGLGLLSVRAGLATGAESYLIFSCVAYAAGTTLALLTVRAVPLQLVATVSTIYFTFYLSAGAVIAITASSHPLNLFAYLVWFFPLLVFNKLVNAPLMAGLLGKTIMFAPLAIVGGLSLRLLALLTPELCILVGAFCLSNLAAGLTLDIVTRFREKYIAERARAEGFKLESELLSSAQARLREQAELLDKAQDAIFVHDMDARVIYWNKGAERLYGWAPAEVAGRLLTDIFPAAAADLDDCTAAVGRDGEWCGELSQSRRDGSALIVESRCTLVRAADGTPRSILAINTDITNRKAAEAKIQRLAFYDALTDLPNRLLLCERLGEVIASGARETRTGAVFVINLDDFKTLNDTLGHARGDAVLAQVASRLRERVGPAGTVARLGGDEFAVMVHGLDEDAVAAAAQATAVGKTLLEAVFARYELGGQQCDMSASIGIVLFAGHAVGADELLKQADLAMYRAKALGRNAMCFFDPAMETLVAWRAALLADLRGALQRGEFELHYQPQVDQLGQVMGAEALLRWPHPRRGMVSPADFIPLAEEAGLIVELGRWVLETACSQLAAWSAQTGMENLTVAVNVSVRQFLDSDFVLLVGAVLAASGANPHRLKLEITESTMMEKVDDTIEKMTALKALEVGFSLDDFGTGYSSLSHLKRLPLDQLKIDQSFVRDVLSDPKDASIARTIITLGQNLNLFVIAEGVETEAQRDFLYREGCYAYQGYLFSKALPAVRFEAFVAAAYQPPAIVLAVP